MKKNLVTLTLKDKSALKSSTVMKWLGATSDLLSKISEEALINHYHDTIMFGTSSLEKHIEAALNKHMPKPKASPRKGRK